MDFALEVRAALATTLILAFAPPGWAQDKDNSRNGFETKHIFGFTEGTDVGEAGDKELEFTTTGSIGKRGGGGYTAIEQQAVYEAGRASGSDLKSARSAFRSRSPMSPGCPT